MKKLLIVGLIGWACLISSVFAIDFSFNNTNTTTYYSLERGTQWRVVGSNIILDSVDVASTFYDNNEHCLRRFIGTQETQPGWNSRSDSYIIASGVLDHQLTIPVGIELLSGNWYYWRFYVNNANPNNLSCYQNSSTFNGFPADSGNIANVNGFTIYDWNWYVNRTYGITNITYSLPSTVDFPDIYVNGNLIVSDLENDFYITYSGDGSSDYDGTHLRITGLWASSYQNSIIQGLNNLNYTGYSFNIGVGVIPSVVSGVLFINSYEYSGGYTFIGPLDYSGSHITTSGNVFDGFVSNIGKLFFSNLGTWIALFGGLLVLWFLGRVISKRR